MARMQVATLLRNMGAPADETLSSLQCEIADDCAIADIHCHSYDSVLTESERIYQVTNAPKPWSDADREQAEYDTRALQRAVRYLILRQRIKIVARSGGTWVRILAA